MTQSSFSSSAPAARSATNRLPIKTGDQFQLRCDVDRFPDFVAPAGLTGTVTWISEDHDVWGKMDQVIPNAEEWDNEIHWPNLSEFLDDTLPVGEFR